MSRNDPPALLVINAGSSSLKFALYALGAGPDGKAVLSGEVSGLPTRPRLSWRDARASTHADHNLELGDDAQGAALAGVLEMLAQHAGDHHLLAVGHRVVHGGTRFSAPL